MGKKKDRVLRFAVTGALLMGVPACGGGETHSNEPAPEHTNEPAHVNEPAAEDTTGDEMGTEGEGDLGETVNEPDPGDEPEEEPIRTNEVAPD